MTTTQTQLDPKSYVARVIEELEANREARVLLLRALLTDENGVRLLVVEENFWME